MFKIIVSLSKYIFMFLMCIYTFMSYRIYAVKDESERTLKCVQQNILMFTIHFLAFAILFINNLKMDIVALYGFQVLFIFIYIIVFHAVYKKANYLLLNNMCMLIMIGFIVITRLSFSEGIRQFMFVLVGAIATLFIPMIMRKVKTLRNIPWVYGAVGIFVLLLVLILGQTKYGATLSIQITEYISFQPGEFVKIMFVFFVAAMLNKSTSFGNVVITTILAAIHVIILVLSTDLGTGLIFFVVYLVMLFVATKEIIYVVLGLTAGSGAAAIAYKFFSHVRVRVLAWQDPWSYIDNQGYQITQSLFAIGMGSWFGVGLNEGMPYKIPFVEMDFIFSAICEELGIIFAICMIFVIMNTFMLMMDVGMKSKSIFYKLLAVGLATTYGFQAFLTIGGGIKFIPLTGVTLPLVSYGGSSVLSTLILFAVVQGLSILSNEER